MNALTVLGIINYGLVLLYGLFLSVAIAGGCKDRREKVLIAVLCPVFLLIQTPCWLILGVDVTKRLYPLIVHLPLALAMIFGLKKPVGVTLISICTAYLCCQLPRFGNIVAAVLTDSPLAGEIAYTLLIVPIYFLLSRFIAPAAYNAIADSHRSLLLFGSLPVAYYLFDYATTIYTNLLYEGSRALVETLPSMLIAFYVVFLAAYRQQLQKRSQTELQSSLLTTQLKQAERELAALRRTEKQSVIYRHDMRHHLTAIDGFLSIGKSQQAREYIKKVESDIDAVTPKRFCENELVNLLCPPFSARAGTAGVRLTVKADLPSALSISDTDLCAMLSNGLENALNAAEGLEEAERRWINCYCAIRAGKLLIEIRNPYAGQIVIRKIYPCQIRRDMAAAAAASRPSLCATGACASSRWNRAFSPSARLCPRKRQAPEKQIHFCSAIAVPYFQFSTRFPTTFISKSGKLAKSLFSRAREVLSDARKNRRN